MAHKRGFTGDDPDEDHHEDKKQRSSLSSVVLEAMRMHTMQKFWSMMEPMLRRVVNEEVERALAKFTLPKVGARNSSKQLQGSEANTNLRLKFENKLACPIFTGSRVEGEQGAPISVVLQDAATGENVTSGNEAAAKLEIVVLEGDFPYDEDDSWTLEEFENYEVKEREGKPPLVTGELSVCLNKGSCPLGDLIFTDNSSWIRSRKFRLGVKVSPNSCEGLRIREARTEAFAVKDHRGELYKKHYPPVLIDEVWRLEKIGKDGAYHKRLNKEGINTVQDFLQTYYTEPQKLRDIFGSNMSNRMWDAIIEHAKTCELVEKYRVYYPEDNHGTGVLFNVIFQPVGLLINGHRVPEDSFTETMKALMNRLVQAAYSNLNRIVDYNKGCTEVTGRKISAQGPSGHSTLSNGSDVYGANMIPLQRDLSIGPNVLSKVPGLPSSYMLPPNNLGHPLFTYDGRRDNHAQQQIVEQRNQIVANPYTMRMPTSNIIPSASCAQNFTATTAARFPPLFSFPPSRSSLSFPPSTHTLDRAAIVSNGYFAQQDLNLNEDTDPICQALQQVGHIIMPTEGGSHNSSSKVGDVSSLGGSDYDAMHGVDDMQLQVQQLLRAFSSGGPDSSASPSLFSSKFYMHSGGSDSDEAIALASPDCDGAGFRMSGKTYNNYGWVKLKAALKWGIFRKAAARKKIHIQEIE